MVPGIPFIGTAMGDMAWEATLTVAPALTGEIMRRSFYTSKQDTATYNKDHQPLGGQQAPSKSSIHCFPPLHTKHPVLGQYPPTYFSSLNSTPVFCKKCFSRGSEGSR